MNNTLHHPLSRWLILACLASLLGSVPASAQEPATTEEPATAAEPATTEEPAADQTTGPQEQDSTAAESTEPGAEEQTPESEPESAPESEDTKKRRRGEVVAVGDDAHLAADETAITVVAVFGDARAEGDVASEIVAVMGDAYANGRVGSEVVAVLGNAYVNSRVGGDVVAVMGSVELGPQADVGSVVTIGGKLTRDPAATVRGGVEQIFHGGFPASEWLRPWVRHALVYLRLLAFEPGLEWAWTLALGFLAFYALLALLFREAVEQCARTLTTHPGQSVLASLIAVVFSPVVIVLLCITVIGIALVPFVGVGLLIAALLGKAALLAAIGGRVTLFFPEGGLRHPAIGVLVGGVLVLLLYAIPIVGFLAYMVLGMLSVGVVLQTLLVRASRSRAAAAQARAGAPGAPPPPAPTPTPAPTADPSGAAFAAAAGGPVSTTIQAGPDSPAGAQGDQSQTAGDASAAPANGPQQAAPAGASPVNLATLPRAGLWLRLAGLFLDALLIVLIFSLIDFGGDIWLIALAGYAAAMWKLKGTTIGGIICGLRVVRLDGREIDWPTAIVRALACFLSAAVAGLGFIWIALDPERQAWHDKIAGTAVVLAPRGSSLV